MCSNMAALATLLSFVSLLSCSTTLAELSGIPTLPFTTSGSDTFDLTSVRSITVDSKYASATDQDGWTLIPPTLSKFAQTFADDLHDVAGCGCSVDDGDSCPENGILLTMGNSSDFRDAAGRWTSEGYIIEVRKDGVTITGASPLGVWWGTRTVLQQAVLNNGKMAVGSGTDAPGWNTRGIFVRSVLIYGFGITSTPNCFSNSSMPAAISTPPNF